MESDPAPAVVHLLNELRPSGLERMLQASAPHTPGGPEHVRIIGIGADHPYAEALRAAGYNVLLLNAGGGYLRNSIRLFRALRSMKPQVIHLHTERPYLLSTLVSLIAAPDAVRVRTIHSLFAKKGLRRLARRLQYRIADRSMDAIIGCSDEVTAFEVGQGRHVATIWNWVSDEFFQIRMERLARGVRQPGEALLIVGNCSAIKNHEVAVAAAKRLQDAGHRLPLLHIGDESNASAFESALLDELAVSGALIERGVQNAADVMRRNAIFLLPSRWEGFSVALAEAIVAGIPALVADVPGLQWARDYSSVRFVSGSGADEWAAAVLAINSSRGRRMEGEPKVERYSARTGITRYYSLYGNILRSRRIPRGGRASIRDRQY